MSRYIDADELKKDLVHRIIAWNEHTRGMFPTYGESNMPSIIDEQPTADVVNVVRCGECRHWQNGHICLAWSRYGTIETTAEQFCSSGERKDEVYYIKGEQPTTVPMDGRKVTLVFVGGGKKDEVEE